MAVYILFGRTALRVAYKSAFRTIFLGQVRNSDDEHPVPAAHANKSAGLVDFTQQALSVVR